VYLFCASVAEYMIDIRQFLYDDKIIIIASLLQTRGGLLFLA